MQLLQNRAKLTHALLTLSSHFHAFQSTGMVATATYMTGIPHLCSVQTTCFRQFPPAETRRLQNLPQCKPWAGNPAFLSFPQTPKSCTIRKAQHTYTCEWFILILWKHHDTSIMLTHNAGVNAPVRSPTHSAEAHCCTVRILDRKSQFNAMLSIHTFLWTVKSIAIPLNTWLCTLLLNAAIYQLCFTAKNLLAAHLLSENQELCFPFAGGRPVAACAATAFADSDI